MLLIHQLCMINSNRSVGEAVFIDIAKEILLCALNLHKENLNKKIRIYRKKL